MEKFEAIPEDGGNTVTLCDDSSSDKTRGRSIAPDWLPDEARTIQESNPARAAYSTYFDRKNKKTRFTITVRREFPTRAACTAFKRDHPAQVPTACTLVYTHDGTVTYIKGCIADVRCVDRIGVKIHHAYDFVGGQMRSSP